jgi:hypothetical protein
LLGVQYLDGSELEAEILARQRSVNMPLHCMFLAHTSMLAYVGHPPSKQFETPTMKISSKDGA